MAGSEIQYQMLNCLQRSWAMTPPRSSAPVPVNVLTLWDINDWAHPEQGFISPLLTRVRTVMFAPHTHLKPPAHLSCSSGRLKTAPSHAAGQHCIRVRRSVIYSSSYQPNLYSRRSLCSHWFQKVQAGCLGRGILGNQRRESERIISL